VRTLECVVPLDQLGIRGDTPPRLAVMEIVDAADHGERDLDARFGVGVEEIGTLAPAVRVEALVELAQDVARRGERLRTCPYVKVDVARRQQSRDRGSADVSDIHVGKTLVNPPRLLVVGRCGFFEHQLGRQEAKIAHRSRVYDLERASPATPRVEQIEAASVRAWERISAA